LLLTGTPFTESTNASAELAFLLLIFVINKMLEDAV